MVAVSDSLFFRLLLFLPVAAVTEERDSRDMFLYAPSLFFSVVRWSHTDLEIFTFSISFEIDY